MLKYEYDELSDIMTINGMCYSGSLFEAWAEGGMDIGTKFMLIKREDGVVTIEILED